MLRAFIMIKNYLGKYNGNQIKILHLRSPCIFNYSVYRLKILHIYYSRHKETDYAKTNISSKNQW